MCELNALPKFAHFPTSSLREPTHSGGARLPSRSDTAIRVDTFAAAQQLRIFFHELTKPFVVLVLIIWN